MGVSAAVLLLLPFSNSSAAAAALLHLSTCLQLIRSAVQVSAQAREYGGEVAGASKRTIENVRQQAGFIQLFTTLLYGAGALQRAIKSAVRGADLDLVQMAWLSEAFHFTSWALIACRMPDLPNCQQAAAFPIPVGDS